LGGSAAPLYGSSANISIGLPYVLQDVLLASRGHFEAAIWAHSLPSAVSAASASLHFWDSARVQSCGLRTLIVLWTLHAYSPVDSSTYSPVDCLLLMCALLIILNVSD
jgi:hypothetical protein